MSNGLSIRRATANDAPAYARIMGDPAVFPDLMQLPYASEERWRAQLAETLAPARNDLLLLAERDGMVLGMAGLHPVAAVRRRHAMTLGIAVAGEHQGQGVGQALMAALTHYADHWGHVLRIELTVYADNARAIALYRRHGFEVEGRMYGYALRQGCYVDALSMARWHPSPPQPPGVDGLPTALTPP